MNQKESPAPAGTITQKPDLNIPDNVIPVKSSISENLIFFHSTLAELPAEEYKLAMSAICQYLADGIIPPITGLLGVIVKLAAAFISEQQSTPRKRGGQKGNQNARKNKPRNDSETEKTNRNESKRIGNESKHGTRMPIAMPDPATVASTTPASVVVADTPSNLNSNLINLNNINYIKFLNCESETEAEKRNRIKQQMKRFGFVLTDKTVNKIIASVPDMLWLVDGYDFPTYLAKSVTDKYKGKGKTSLDLQRIFLSAINRTETWEAWETYPNWLSERMEQVLIDKKALLRKTPPQNYCPDCGEHVKLDGLRCPQCGGFYQWNDSENRHEFIHHLPLDFSGSFERLINIKKRREQEAQM